MYFCHSRSRMLCTQILRVRFSMIGQCVGQDKGRWPPDVGECAASVSGLVYETSYLLTDRLFYTICTYTA
jgi:hypothetical protein